MLRSCEHEAWGHHGHFPILYCHLDRIINLLLHCPILHSLSVLQINIPSTCSDRKYIDIRTCTWSPRSYLDQARRAKNERPPNFDSPNTHTLFIFERPKYSYSVRCFLNWFQQDFSLQSAGKDGRWAAWAHHLLMNRLFDFWFLPCVLLSCTCILAFRVKSIIRLILLLQGLYIYNKMKIYSHTKFPLVLLNI